MNFDKPKVTIDLEEYQHLKDRVNSIDANEMLMAAKEVIGALATNNTLLGKVLVFLKEERGILVSFHVKDRNWSFGEMITGKEVSISKTQPKNERQNMPGMH